MSSTKEKVILEKSIDYLGAMILIGNKCLMFRCVDENEYYKHGYFFPGCKVNDKYESTSYLIAQLKAKYGLDAKIGRFIGDTVTVENDEKMCLYLFKCTIDKAVSINNKAVSFLLVDPKEPGNIIIDKADKLLLERISYFIKVYQGDFNTPKRPESDIKTIMTLYNTLVKNQDKVAKQDINDFKQLLETNATLKEITEAFQYVLKRAKITLEGDNNEK